MCIPNYYLKLNGGVQYNIVDKNQLRQSIKKVCMPSLQECTLIGSCVHINRIDSNIAYKITCANETVPNEDALSCNSKTEQVIYQLHKNETECLAKKN